MTTLGFCRWFWGFCWGVAAMALIADRTGLMIVAFLLGPLPLSVLEPLPRRRSPPQS